MKNSPDIEDLIENFLEACRHGECPDVKEYAGRYPEHATELEELLPLMMAMEQAGVESSAGVEEQLPNLDEAGFHVLKKIGNGGMGDVFEAEQVALGRRVAVKTLRAGGALTVDRIRQFERESYAIAKLYHPGIVQVYSAGRCGKIFYYAMELVHGKGLDHVHPDDVRQIAKIGFQAAEALAYAHRCGILHRDIKPSNILIDENGRIHISDFGLASMLDDDKGEAFHGGTLRYMSPERVSNGICTAAGDQYALGVTLYELLTRKPMFQAASSRDLAKQIKAGNIPELACPEQDMVAIIMKALRTEPKDRYQTVDEMADDLRRYLEGRPVAATTPSTMRRLWLWSHRNPALAVTVAVAWLAVIAFIIALCTGYMRTRNALRQASRNAENAEQALRTVFAFVENRPPSNSTTKLLSLLLPYYQDSLEQKGLENNKLMEAWRVVGNHAMRIGDFKLAEKACQTMLSLKETPDVMNKLADALRMTGRDDEADVIQTRIMEVYRKSPKQSERLEVFLAMKAIAVSNKDNEGIRQAYDLLVEMLKEEPKSPQLRYQYALLLERYPNMFHQFIVNGLEPNSEAILRDLAEHYPEQAEYAVALVRRMTRSLRHASLDNDEADAELSLPLNLSERLLATFANVPEAVVVAVDFRNAYISALNRAGRKSDSFRERERMISALRGHFFSTDAPDELREALMDTQLRQLRLAVRDNRSTERLFKEIQEELTVYDGSRKAELTEILESLISDKKPN